MKARTVQGPPHRIFLTGRAGQEFEVEDVISARVEGGDYGAPARLVIELQYEPFTSATPTESIPLPPDTP